MVIEERQEYRVFIILLIHYFILFYFSDCVETKEGLQLKHVRRTTPSNCSSSLNRER